MALDAIDAAPDSLAESLQAFPRGVGQRSGIQMRPELLDRIQFRCVGREPFNPQPVPVLFHDFAGAPAQRSDPTALSDSNQSLICPQGQVTPMSQNWPSHQ